jgi:hypothetical protein
MRSILGLLALLISGFGGAAMLSAKQPVPIVIEDQQDGIPPSIHFDLDDWR